MQAPHDSAFLCRGCEKVFSEADLQAKLALGRPLRVKLGVDPTAPDIHLGHSVSLTKLRDLLARRVLVIVTAQALHDLVEQLHALGFSQMDSPADSNTNSKPDVDPAWQIWQFNILDYKQVPDWLNAKFWANPENFHKYRW